MRQPRVLLTAALIAACGGEQSQGTPQGGDGGAGGQTGAGGGAGSGGGSGNGGSGGSVGGPWRLVQRLLPEDVDTTEQFGIAVALRGSLIAVTRSAQAYVFVEKNGSWTQAQKLEPSDPPSAGYFGERIALGTDGTIAVGAPRANIGGDEARGAVYVYERNGDTWSESAKLIASDGLALDLFGSELALEGDTLLVGLLSQRPTQPVYHFQRSAGAWSEAEKVESTDSLVPKAFGFRFTLSGDDLVIGAISQSGFTVPDAAYQFHRSGGAWQEVRKLTRGGLDDWFGLFTAVDGDQVLSGVPQAKQGDQMVGGVDVFRLADGSLVQTLEAYPGSLPNFGTPVRAWGGRALIGSRDLAETTESTKTGLAAYVRSGDQWFLEGPIDLPPGVKQLDEFGLRFAMDGPIAAIAAPADDAMGPDLGAVYVYTTLPP